MQVAADGKSDGGWSEAILDDLGEADDEADLGTKCPLGIDEGAAGPRNGARQLGVAKDEAHVEGGGDEGGQHHAPGAALLEAVVPAEVAARDDVADAEAPNHDGAKGALEVGLVHG